MAKTESIKSIKVCKAKDCDGIPCSNGYCHKHSRQIKRYGKTFKTQYDPNVFKITGEDCFIYLRDRYGNDIGVAVVDKCDYHIVKDKKWRISNGYVRTGIGKNQHMLHYFLLGELKGKYVVDHIDRNPLNNRRSNLRIATRSENIANTNVSKNNKCMLKGVSKWKHGKFRSAIVKNRKQHHIGLFEDKYEAAKAYDKKAVELFGEFALTNKRLGLI